MADTSTIALGRSRWQRRFQYACRALGVVAFALWLIPVMASEIAPTYVGDTPTPVPSGRTVYLSNYSASPVTCYLTPHTGEARAFTLTPIRSIWRFDGLLGVKVDRWFSGPAHIDCNASPSKARMVGGTFVSLFPLAQGIELPALAFLLVVIGWRDQILRPALNMQGTRRAPPF